MITPTVARGKKDISHRSINECTEFLSSLQDTVYEKESLERVQLLNSLCGSPASKVASIFIGGGGGKSETALFASKLLLEEGFSVGVAYSTHILSFVERIKINNQPVSQTQLAQVFSKVIDKALEADKIFTSFEIVTVAAFMLFEEMGVSVAIFETSKGGKYDALAAFKPLIVAITKITIQDKDVAGKDLDDVAVDYMGIAKKGSWIISAEHSKLRLKKMKEYALENGLKWEMPVRKLAPLPYIYEQIYGKQASLAEKAVQVFVEVIKGKFSPFLRGNILVTKKGQRGRPTLEAKKNAKENPLKTMKEFWQENFELRKGSFEILDKEEQTIILDDSSDIEGLESLFLAIRLLHYKKEIKNLCLVISLSDNLDHDLLIKHLKYMVKKIPVEIYFVSMHKKQKLEGVLSLTRTLGFKSYLFDDLVPAFEKAKASASIDDGLIVITGSKKILADYWTKVREVKKII